MFSHNSHRFFASEIRFLFSLFFSSLLVSYGFFFIVAVYMLSIFDYYCSLNSL
ncbi:hypothetical protein Lalb_Chr16g0378081 [Lupinus albus]|uniref:Uncharacterized protein n=1 Tax=Lupinus albus TaxID=3870 RepID=A0A6A4PAL1_LUPAL|nr:hypothetical protein Lalb_Chr16g0378081 [Lupinus albus]